MIRFIILVALVGTIGTVQSTRSRIKLKPYDCGYSTKYYHPSQGSKNNVKFPWTVAILKKVDKTEKYKCDGSLIHPQVVLTVANCCNLTENEIFIRAGTSDPSSGDLNRYQDKIVKSIIIHENYNPSTQENNFALLYLNEPIDMNAENVGIVCLPRSTNVFHNKKCKISFLDKDTNDTFNGSGNLKKANKKVTRDPLIESDLSGSAKHQHQNVKRDPLIESDLSGNSKHQHQNVMRDPLIESDLSGNSNHQYGNVIRDPLIESDLSGILKSPSKKVAKDPLVESDLSRNPKHQYGNVIRDPLIESDLSGSAKHQHQNVKRDPLIESDLSRNPKHQYGNVIRDPLIESDLSGSAKHQHQNVKRDPLIESDLAGNSNHQYGNVIRDPLIESDVSGISKSPSKKVTQDPLVESDLSGNSKRRYKNQARDLSSTVKNSDEHVRRDSLIESDYLDAKKFILKIKNAAITIKESRYCQSNNPSTKHNKSFICGFSQTRQVCEATEGSPVVCPHPNDIGRWVQVGSFIFRCENPTNKQTKNRYYVNIADARNWIDEKLNILIAQ